jgi:hypothetical protein
MSWVRYSTQQITDNRYRNSVLKLGVPQKQNVLMRRISCHNLFEIWCSYGKVVDVFWVVMPCGWYAVHPSSLCLSFIFILALCNHTLSNCMSYVTSNEIFSSFLYLFMTLYQLHRLYSTKLRMTVDNIRKIIGGTKSNTISIRSILMLSSHPCLDHPSGIFPSSFPTKIIFLFLFFPMHPICCLSHSPRFDHPNNIWQRVQTVKFFWTWNRSQANYTAMFGWSRVIYYNFF